VSASVNLPLHHKVQKFCNWHRLTRVVPEKGCKTVVVVWYFALEMSSFDCDRKRRLRALSVTSSMPVDQITTANNLCLYCEI